MFFFPDPDPVNKLQHAQDWFAEADVLLVVGATLPVHSGRRFIYQASEAELPIGIVIIGPTRADDLAAARVEGRLGEVLPRLADALLHNRLELAPQPTG